MYQLCNMDSVSISKVKATGDEREGYNADNEKAVR